MSENYHPSNRLFRGECRDFSDAIETYIAQCEWEKSSTFDKSEEAEFIGLLDEGLTVARRLQAEYNAALRGMEQKLIEKWRDEGELEFEFANALVSGDYSALAI